MYFINDHNTSNITTKININLLYTYLSAEGNWRPDGGVNGVQARRNTFRMSIDLPWLAPGTRIWHLVRYMHIEGRIVSLTNDYYVNQSLVTIIYKKKMSL